MKHHLYSRLLELRFEGSQESVKKVTWVAHLYVAGKLLEPERPLWPDMEFAIHRQGIDYLFGQAPQNFAECRYMLKRANGVSAINTARETYKPKQAHLFRSPRIMGNILSGQMDSRGSESIYHALRRFICNPTSQAQLLDQCNIPAGTIPTILPFRLGNEPRYASVLEDLTNHWLPADLVDLYFDWTHLVQSCTEIVSNVEMVVSAGVTPCPITNINEDLFSFVLWFMDQAAKTQAPGVRPLEKRVLLESLTGFARTFQVLNMDIISDGDVKIWKSDGALVKLMERCASKQFFRKDGPANFEKLYAGWKRKEKRHSRFWRYMNQD